MTTTHNMEKPCRTIVHHYDDEPANISSLRDNILYLVMRTKPDYIHLDEIPEDDDEATPFLIRLHLETGAVFEIEYRIYSDSRTFCEQARISDGDIILLDAYERGASGEPVAGVKDCLEKIPVALSRDRLFLVSAFTSELPQALKNQFLEQNIIRKPFDLNETAKRLLRLVGINLQSC